MISFQPYDAGLSTRWIAIATIGLSPIVGSFLGVLIRRLPDGRPIAIGRSKCDSCDTVLGAHDLVPLVSYLLLRGRCRYCRNTVGLFYPGIELASLAVAVSAVRFSTSETMLLNCLLGWVLLTLAWIDIRTYLLPDKLTLPLIAAGIAQAWILQRDLLEAFIGAGVGFFSIWVLELGYRRLRGRDGIGLGDAKLFAAAGAWLGWESLPVVILAASLCALAAVGISSLAGQSIQRHTAVAFGPFLAFAIWAARLLDPMDFLLYAN